ncbi:TorD/DmsD family molecular chaperone [Calidifontibacillus oryziterrae]|uniref:TorD/DmsD family molecular chaperone n=1 Tax=Calidifontibacillus oryziterrae TaxID=1191699 RepID=UPI000302CC70|nr:molecular chaperone TorD family protein [Calidifontibacillus oryziterrae]
MTSQLIQAMEERSFQYEFLHTVFSSPLSIELLKEWKNQSNFNPFEAQEHLIAFFSELSSLEIEKVEEKERESFLQLFFGPEHIPAPPWESVYRTKERILFGEPTLQMRKKLREFNLYFQNESKEPEDHISIELEFMIYLIDEAIKSIKEGDENKFSRALEYQFLLLNDHLMNWIDPFTDDIQSATTSSLYKGSALLLRDFINQDYQYLLDIKEVINHE